MIRLFIAFPIESAVKKHLAAISGRFKSISPTVKWVDPNNMHLTARFLGDTDPKIIQPIVELIQSTCEKFGPVQATVERIGGFPNLKRPRVLWVGLSELADNLTPIVQELQNGLRGLGISPDEKRFKAHLTLARIKQPLGLERFLEELERFKFEPIQITFDRMELIESILTPQGPIYKTLGLGQLADRFV